MHSQSNIVLNINQYLHVSGVIMLQLNDGDSWLVPNPEACIDWLTEGDLEAVDERHSVPYGVKGQSTPSMVKKHANTGRVRRVDFYLVFAVAGRVAGVRAEEAPGLAVVADAAAVSVTRPLDAFVGDSDGSSFPAPVHLPVVGSACEGLLTQDLGQGVKPWGAVGVVLGFSL